jgi:hypothetical protein
VSYYEEGQHKDYSEKDNNENDPLSKQISAEFLLQIDHKCHLDVPIDEQPNRFGDWDYLIQYEDKTLAVEAERKIGWISTDGTFLVVSKNCPEGRIYNTVDVSKRKKKSKADLFIMCNCTYDAICMTAMKNVLAAGTKPKDTRFGTRQEPFFKVEKSLCKFYILQNGVWQRA